MGDTAHKSITRGSSRKSSDERRTGQVVRQRPTTFNGVKVFSATMYPRRDQLGEEVTGWLADHPNVTLTDIIVTQSSDSDYHCLAFTVFYWDPGV